MSKWTNMILMFALLWSFKCDGQNMNQKWSWVSSDHWHEKTATEHSEIYFCVNMLWVALKTMEKSIPSNLALIQF